MPLKVFNYLLQRSVAQRILIGKMVNFAGAGSVKEY